MVVEELKVRLLAEAEQFKKDFQNIQQNLQNWKKGFDEVGKTAIVAGGAITGALGLAVKWMADEEKAQVRLAAQMKAVNQYSKEQFDSIVNLANAMQSKLGIDDVVIQETARMGYQFGFSTEQIKQLLPVVANLSVAMGVDMTTAMQRMGTVLEGNYNALRRYGINLSDLSEEIGKTKQAINKYNSQLEELQKKHEQGKIKTKEYEQGQRVLTEAIAELQKRLEDLQSPQTIVNKIIEEGTHIQGLAEAQAETLAGQIEILKASFEDAGKKVGAVLIPILKDLIQKYLMPLIEKFAELDPKVVENGVKFTAFAGTILLVGGTISKLISLFTSLGSLFTPQGLILVGIGAFIVLLVKIIENWDKIKAGFTNFYKRYIKPWLDPTIAGLKAIIGFFEKIADFFKNLWGKVKEVANTAGSIASTPVTEAYGGMATGGYVSRPTLTWVGEREPEYVIPESKMGVNVTYNIYGASDINTLKRALKEHDQELLNSLRGGKW